MTRESISTIFIIVFLSTLLVLSTRSVMIQPVFGKNNDIGQMSTEDYSCRYQALRIGSLCQAEKSNIQSYDTNAREHNSNFGDPEARMDTFMKHYDEYQAEELGTYGFDQNDSVSNRGNTNSNESVTPTLAGHNGGSPGGGNNHNGGSPGGGNNHNGGSPGGGNNHNGGSPGGGNNHNGGSPGGGNNHNGGSPGGGNNHNGGSPGGGNNHNGGSPGGGNNHNGGSPGGGNNHNGGSPGGGNNHNGGSPGGGNNHNGGSPGGGNNHNGGSPGGGNNHNGGSPGGGNNHNGNNDQNDKSNGDRGASSCTPVTLSDLPGQTRPLAICLVTGKDTNVATEIGFATFTLVQLNGEEFRLTINGLNGQTQPAIVTVASGATSPITVPGLGTGNVLIGNAYSVILDVPRMSS